MHGTGTHHNCIVEDSRPLQHCAASAHAAEHRNASRGTPLGADLFEELAGKPEHDEMQRTFPEPEEFCAGPVSALVQERLVACQVFGRGGVCEVKKPHWKAYLIRRGE